MEIKSQKFLYAAFILLYLFSASSSAQDVKVHPCNACSDAQMEAVATSKGVGIKYIYDLSSAVIVGYEVTREDYVAGQWTLVASPFVPESWMVSQYLGVQQFYNQSGNSLHGTMAAAVPSAAGDSVNAYDVTGSSVDRNRVTDSLANNPKLVFTSVMASFGRAIRLSGIVTPDVALTTTVNFPDGSRVIYKFNWDTKKWEYVEGTAVDSNGNSIPESPSDFVNGAVGRGEFDFSRPGGNLNDIQDWINRASAAGITVVGNGVRYACVTANGITSCTKVF